MFCPKTKCRHYNEATKYPRKCYYEMQCWRGYLDLMVAVTKLGVKYAFGKSISETRRD